MLRDLISMNSIENLIDALHKLSYIPIIKPSLPIPVDLTQSC